VGIVRIFSKKVEFLEKDCKETLKTLTESFQAIYWTNHKKSMHVLKKTKHMSETFAGGTHMGMDLFESLQAHYDQVVISVPERFELDLFDLEIADDWYEEICSAF
jgi:N terminus of Rad21 / Rec8 like protein